MPYKDPVAQKAARLRSRKRLRQRQAAHSQHPTTCPDLLALTGTEWVQLGLHRSQLKGRPK
jgi:hypothetical protein